MSTLQMITMKSAIKNLLKAASLASGAIMLICPLATRAQTGEFLPPPPASSLPAPGAFADQQMKALDRNNDQRVTWEEFSAQLKKAFVDMDTHRRGYLTRADLLQAYKAALVAHGQPVPKE